MIAFLIFLLIINYFIYYKVYIQMTRCKCIAKSTGEQCKLQCSSKKGDNPFFCSRYHQQCKTSDIVNEGIGKVNKQKMEQETQRKMRQLIEIEEKAKQKAEKNARQRIQREEKQQAEKDERQRIQREEKQQAEKDERQRVEREEKHRIQREEKQRIQREEKHRIQREEKQRIQREEKLGIQREEKNRVEREEKLRTEREEKLRTEREEKQRAEREARQKIERIEREEKQRIEREEKQRIERQEKRRIEREEKLRIEREEKLRIEREEKQRIERDARQRAERDARQRAERDAKKKAERQVRQRTETQSEQDKLILINTVVDMYENPNTYKGGDVQGWISFTSHNRDPSLEPIFLSGDAQSGSQERTSSWKIHINIDPNHMRIAIPVILNLIFSENAPKLWVKIINFNSKQFKPNPMEKTNAGKQISMVFPDATMRTHLDVKITKLLQNIQNNLEGLGIDRDPRPINIEWGQRYDRWENIIYKSNYRPSFFNYRNEMMEVMDDELYDDITGDSSNYINQGFGYLIRTSYFIKLPPYHPGTPGMQPSEMGKLNRITPIPGIIDPLKEVRL